MKERPQWYIPEEIATKHEIKECGEPLVDIEDEAERLGISMIFSPVAPEYSTKMYLRSGVIQRLLKAAHRLQKRSDSQYVLEIYDTFRPLELQRKLFEKIQKEIIEKEGLYGKALWERTTQFIADPKLCPPHSTGGAVDLTIVDIKTKKELDMGTTVDTIDSKAHTWNAGITAEQKKNRKLLYDVMTNVGFVNLASEWWHFSYGDQYWAIFNEREYALYDSVEKAPE